MISEKTIWTKEAILADAKKYQSLKDWRTNNSSAYVISKKRGWFEEVSAHFKSDIKRWNFNSVKEEALKYRSKIEFYKKNSSAYNHAYKRGFLDEVCSHMKLNRRKWTKEDLAELAKKYRTKSEFYKKDCSAYTKASRLGILNEICSHMEIIQKKDWTTDSLINTAKQYQHRSEFQKKSNNAYQAAQERGILDLVCSHMENQLQYWSYSRAYDIMKTFKGTKTDLKIQYPGFVGFLKKEKLLSKFYKEFNVKSTMFPSKPEIDFKNWIKKHYQSAESRWFEFYRKGKKIRREIDVFIPELNLGFEFNGLIAHSELRKKDNKYHIQKRELFSSIGVKILQINSDEWFQKQDIVKSIILSKIHRTPNKLHARKLEIRPVGRDSARIFLTQNHLMGHYKAATYFGLFDKQELVSIIGYRKKRDGIDISRFCNKTYTNIPGSLSKLLNHAIKQTNAKVVYYDIDLRYGFVDGIQKLGFELKSVTLGWKWTDGVNTYNRLKCRANMDSRRLTEKQHAQELGWVKIYDAGQAHFTSVL